MAPEPKPAPAARTLADRLADGPLPHEEVARIGAGVARTLARLHRDGRVHGAVSPENVLLGEAPTTSDPPRPLPGDIGSDIHALGVVLYRMLAGEPPADPIRPIRTAVPATLEHITRRALLPIPDRYPHADHIADALEAWLAIRGVPEVPSRVRSTPRTIGIAASMAVGVVLVAVGAAGIGRSWWAGPSPEPQRVQISEDLVLDGVRFDGAHAERALVFVNTAPAEVLGSAGLYDRGVDVVIAHRPFASLEAFGAVPGIGAKTVEAVAAATRTSR